MSQIVKTYVFALTTTPTHGAYEHVPFTPEGLWVEELPRKRIAKDKQRLRPFHARCKTKVVVWVDDMNMSSREESQSRSQRRGTSMTGAEFEREW